MTQMRTEFNIIVNHILGDGQEKVNVVRSLGKAPAHKEYGYEEDAYYVNDEMGGFWTNAQGSNQDTSRKSRLKFQPG